MFCPPCKRERSPQSRYCVVCGSALVARPTAAVEAELSWVRWLLEELEAWDELAPAPVRAAVRRRYEGRARVLAEVLAEGQAAPVEVRRLAGPVSEPTPAIAPRLATLDVAPLAAAPLDATPLDATPLDATPLDATPLAAAPKRASPSRRPPPVRVGPSAWERFWKPMLGESVGWFIGAFLILAGTFTFVADAWATMSSTGRALTVFGLAVFWTLGFAAWAKMLSRREATAPAARVLWRIAAAVAPLATVALGPLVADFLLAWPLLLAQSFIAGLLALRAARDVWGGFDDAARGRAEAVALAVAMAGATVVLGAAPVLTWGPLGWLELLPVALWTSIAWRFGPLAVGPRTAFSLAAMAYAVALFAVRLHVALLAAGREPPWGVHAVALSAFALVALELLAPGATEPKRARGAPPPAADALSVVAVAAQTLVLGPAFFAQSPAFVLAAFLAAVTTARLAGRVGPPPVAGARWLVLTYVFGYVAFQRIDQLVPAMVVAWYQALKAALGYAEAPLPPGYASVYAALYVVAVGGLAARWLTALAADARDRARADLLLKCTTWGALSFGALALASIGADARPAVVALPVLTLATLGLGLWLDRDGLVRSGAALLVGTGLALFASSHVAWPVAALALLAALVSVPAYQTARHSLSLAALLLVALALGFTFAGTSPAGDAVALALASAAALLVARNLDDRTLLAVAWFVPALFIVRFGAPWMLPAAALGTVAALPNVGGSRRATLFPVTVAAALAGPAWELLQARDWPTLTLALGGLALTGGAFRMAKRGPAPWYDVATGAGLLFFIAALLPWSSRLPAYHPWQAQGLAALAAVAVSVDSVRRGRHWQRVWLAGLLVASGLLSLVGEAHWQAGLVRAAVVVLLATPALWAVVTLPLASGLLAGGLFAAPTWLVLVAAGLSLAALGEAWSPSARFLFNRARVAWVASALAAALLAGAIALGANGPVVLFASAALPLAWTRATRHPAVLALGLALSAVAGVWLGARGWLLLVAPALALFDARLVLGTALGRRLVHLDGDASRVPVVSAAVGLGVAVGFSQGLPAVGAAWALAVLLAGGELAWLNVVGVAVVASFSDVAHLEVAWALMGVAALTHLAPISASKLLGWTQPSTVAPAAALGAVVVAAVGSTLHGGAALQATVPLALGEAAALAGWWWLGAAAVATAGVELHLLWLGRVPLAPWGPAVATASAAMAALSRLEPAAEWARRVRGRLRLTATAPPSRPWWWGTATLVFAALLAPSGWWLLPAALLLWTPVEVEVAVSAALGVAMVVLVAPREQAALALACLGAGLGWLGAWRAGREPVARTWLHVGWAAALAAVLLAGLDVGVRVVPLVWLLAAATGWAVAKRSPKLEGLGWAVSWVATHVLVAHLGVVLATGAPEALVLAYFSLASAALALVPALSDRGQARPASLVLGWAAVLELVVALSVLTGPHHLEAGVAVVAGLLVLAGAGRRALRDDDGAAAWLAEAVVVVTALAVRRLGAGVAPGLFEAWAAMVWGTALWGLARFLAREDRPSVASALRGGAVAWPLVGLVAAPWASPPALVLLLLVTSAHYAWLAQTGLRRVGAAASAIAFNAGMVAAFFASGWQGPADLALPAGLSVLALTHAFRAELGRDVQVKLRALAMTAVYAAASWRPLSFTTAWGLIFAVVVCVVGVAAGAALRIRSFVLVGTGFLVTSVVATLVRQGLAEPRLGAVLLAALGLGVVAFMVLLTTRRAELAARLTSLRTAMSRWEG